MSLNKNVIYVISSVAEATNLYFASVFKLSNSKLLLRTLWDAICTLKNTKTSYTSLCQEAFYPIGV